MDSVYILTADGELHHHGIKGMRWGVRRYQTKNGSLTPAGKKRYDKDMAKVKAETRKLKNQQRTDAKLGKLEAAKKNLKTLKNERKGKSDDFENNDSVEDIETKKARILQSRSAKELYKNANLFTTNELQAAKFRLELERNIKNLEPPEIDKGKQFANKFIEKAETASSVIQSGSKTYNNVAKIYNSFFGNKRGATLPIISDSTTSNIDKFKQETEWIKAKNERKKAQEDAKEKVKSDLEKLRDETAWIDAQNKNREAKRAARKHDESDKKEAEKAAKEKAAAKESEKKRKEETTERRETNEQHNDSKDQSSTSSSDSDYSYSFDTSSATRGQSYANNYSGWNRTYTALPDSSSVSNGKRVVSELVDTDGTILRQEFEDDD